MRKFLIYKVWQKKRGVVDMGIHESIQRMEALRKKCYLVQVLVLVEPLVLLVVMFLGRTGGPDIRLIMFLFFGCTMVGVVFASKWKKEFNLIYKEMFARAALEELLDDVTYAWDRGFTSSDVSKMGLVCMGNRFRSEDYLKASYNGVEFEQSDVTIKNHTGSGKRSKTVTYFKGKMMKFKMPEKSAISLQVFTDNFAYRANTGFPMERIEMEDVEFNRIFDVRTLDGHEAFYVLTPQFMECLKRIAKTCSSIGMHFTRGNLYVAINTGRDSFDAVMSQEIVYPKEKARMEADIQDIIDIIKALGLDKR